ncbi:helix-turn-helix domain-containing protein [Allokutzneria multivorans]|uniref:Helix-turn-helix domain-containing protein n=1 Tax=Allokutzneria multivorans TaxID=1142134 RepID=A0ABP7S3V6_9PSEU
MTTPPQPEDMADPAMLKALVHPLRRRILAELRRGPASATTLAAALERNTGVTSYHLRELERHGFVEEDPALGKGKERWWRRRSRNLRVPSARELSPEAVKLLSELRTTEIAEDLAAWHRYDQEERFGDSEWADTVAFTRGTVGLTRSEFTQFFDEYKALLKRYWRAPEEMPAEARQVLVRFIAFPDPDGK